ncbi:hypothetical protein [Nodularia sp. NIES-3585]|uniref:hypothetical protein n=1 Tax=Nodularia sp. NIES-3585 TaxID=1973477 RepID=UPI001131807C|nr:hypothetical protein [Nodularia sp. NIES-3585]
MHIDELAHRLPKASTKQECKIPFGITSVGTPVIVRKNQTAQRQFIACGRRATACGRCVRPSSGLVPNLFPTWQRRIIRETPKTNKTVLVLAELD